MCRQAKQGLRSAVCIRVSEGHAGTDPRSGLVAQRTSGDGAWAPPTYATGTFQCVTTAKVELRCGGDIRLRGDGRQEPAHFEPEVRKGEKARMRKPV